MTNQDVLIERLFTDLYGSDEWDDDHDDLLKEWRESRGDAGKTAWQWWYGFAAEGEFQEDCVSREAAIAKGRVEFADVGSFGIIEARCWIDEVGGEETCWFAESRNAETIVVSANDAE